MKVSFIIPLYNCLPLTQAMLASLRETLPPGFDFEVILVDDGSTDGTRKWLASLPAPCRAILNEKNSGFAVSCNRGAAAATGEFLFFLNNDLVLLPGWLEPMLTIFRRVRNVGLVGNVQLDAATGAIDHAGIYFNHQGKPAHLKTRPLSTRLLGRPACRAVDALTGACFAVRHAVWKQLGGFDESYVNGCEDIDLCLRAAAAGLRLRVSLRSVVRHHVSASAGRNLRNEQNTFRLMQRWRETILPRIVHEVSWACLKVGWEEPRDYPDVGLAWEAFLHATGIQPLATGRLHAAARASLDLELARWAHLLEGAPDRPAREIAWQFFPAQPTKSQTI